MNPDDIKRYLIRGGAWAFIGKISAAFLGLIMTALLTRLLTPQEMGVYFLAFTLATFFAIPARMGLENTLLRFISQAIARNEPKRARAIIRKGFFLALASTLVVSVCFGLWIGTWVAENVFHSALLGSLSGLIAIWMALLAFQFLFGEVFRAFQDIRSAVLFGGLITSFSSVVFLFVLLILLSRSSLSQTLPLILAAGAINSMIAAWILSKKLNNLRLLPSTTNTHPVEYSELATHSWPLLINAMTYYALSQSDIWVLGAFRTDEEVAIYGAAARIVMLISMALTVVNAIVPPLISRFHAENDKIKLENILRSTATYAAIPSFFILIIFIVFGEWILQIAFGEHYESGYIVLVILSIGQLFNVFVGSCGYTLMMTGHQYIIMSISIFSAIVAILSSILLVRTMGATGVALGYAFAMIIQQLSMLFFTRIYCGVWTHASLRKIAISH